MKGRKSLKMPLLALSAFQIEFLNAKSDFFLIRQNCREMNLLYTPRFELEKSKLPPGGPAGG
jgi:hypothetical protein